MHGNEVDEPLALGDLLSRGLARPERPALVSHEVEWSWSELDAATDRLAANLLALGLQPGDRVASLMPNHSVLLLLYLAYMKAGLVGVPLNYRYMPPEIDHALEVSGASLLIAHAERSADLASSRRAGSVPRGVVLFGAHASGTETGLESLLECEAPGAPPRFGNPGDPAFIFFTSGSTGPAKGVTHSRESLASMFASTRAAFELTADDVVMPGSSISHLGGFLFSFSALSVGARTVVAHTFDPPEILLLLRENRPSVLCMLPAALFSVVRDHRARQEDFSSLRLCRSGSDKVPAELEREFTALTGHDIVEGYGCSEAGLVTMNPPSGLVKAGSVGVAAPGFELAIRGEDGDEVGVGEDGRLWLRSLTVMSGYWDNPEATAETIRDGWLDTGDVMRSDDDGYLWFRGRKKQIIVHDGSNICPQEVEDALLAHPAVAAAGVVGVRDLMHGENVRAYVTLKPGGSLPAPHDLIVFARERIGYKAPELVEVLPEMPLNPTGKVDRVALKKLAEATVVGV